MDNITCTCLSDQVQVDSPGELLHLEHLLHGVEVAHEHADSVEVEDVAVAITDRHMGFVRKRLFFYLPYTSIGTSTHTRLNILVATSSTNLLLHCYIFPHS